MLPALSFIGPVLDSLSSTATEAISKAFNTGKADVTKTASADSGMDFGSVLSQVANQAVDRLKTAEATSISSIQGQASAQQVVETMMQAQQSLQTAIAVRDKIVSAYQAVSQMAI